MSDNKILDDLPSIDKCKKIFQSIAMLDAILIPEWEYRYYLFNSTWDSDEMMASMRDGSGEHYFALFNKYGLIIKGCEQDSNIGKCFLKTGKVDKTLFNDIPIEFNDFLKEPAFIIDESTFCLWNLNEKHGWSFSKNYDSDCLYLLRVLIDGAEGYVRWAEEYCEVDVDLNIVKDIFNFKPLNNEMIYALNDEITQMDIIEDIIEIGYPFEN